MLAAAGAVPDSGDAEAPLRDVLAAALEADERLSRLAEELRAENARLRAERIRNLYAAHAQLMTAWAEAAAAARLDEAGAARRLFTVRVTGRGWLLSKQYFQFWRGTKCRAFAHS